MNNKNRKFENNDYLDFVRQLPCGITGRAGDNIHPHHADVIGRQGIRNDYYTIPLIWNKHNSKGGHITRAKLADDLKEDPRDFIIFLLSLYIEYLQGRYDLDGDRACNFVEYRRRMIGKI